MIGFRVESLLHNMREITCGQGSSRQTPDAKRKVAVRQARFRQDNSPPDHCLVINDEEDNRKLPAALSDCSLTVGAQPTDLWQSRHEFNVLGTQTRQGSPYRPVMTQQSQKRVVKEDVGARKRSQDR